MKRLLLFILILLSNTQEAFTCGFYPYGEEVRFSMYKPNFPAFKEFETFQYSSNYFMPVYADEEFPQSIVDDNIILWSKKYKNSIPLETIGEAVYETEPKDFKASSSNAFVQLLFQLKDTAAIQYLLFAKKCSMLNEKISDPWERNDYAVIPIRGKLIQEALQRNLSTNDADLKKRYAFLAIRLAYYNSQADQVQKIYDTHFSGEKNKSIIDYWSMYFLCLIEENPAKASYYAAQVFAHAPDKRFMAQQQYNTEVNIAEIITLAKTKEEQAAVWLLAAIRNPYKCLPYMQKLYAIDPASPGLAFLLLREINKLEDWIYTPYYTEFVPSLSEHSGDEEFFDALYKERLRKDRSYAKEIYVFTNQVSFSKVYYTSFWKNTQIYLKIMSEDYQGALRDVDTELENKQTDTLLADRLNMFKAFCEVAVQPKGGTHLTLFSKAEIMKQCVKGNNRFVFALSKELEFRDNTTDAAALLSRINSAEPLEEQDGWRKTIFWRTRNGSYQIYGDFYTDYFEYLDFQYTPAQVNDVIKYLTQNKSNDDYSIWVNQRLQKDLDRLYDLTGTKYMRKNDLKNALFYFKQVPDSTWKNERYRYLDSNPFYNDFYTEHNGSVGDTITYTKPELVKTLIGYLYLANNPATKDRDYYYFLAANCYLNMTCYGNSWIMKRYELSSSPYRRTGYNDMDFIEATTAKRYYLKAKQCSKTKKFAALCLRMAGRCEKYLLYKKMETSWKYNEEKSFEDAVFKANKYYRQLEKEYPDDYYELISNCESFEPYFLARR